MRGNELKPRIGIFGRRNYGKSSLINFLTGQEIAIVSDTAGATTDPVRTTMERAGVGPVVWVDTAGIADEGELGQLRVEKTLAELRQADLAIVLLSENRIGETELSFLDMCRNAHVPFLLLYALSDRFPPKEDFLDKVAQMTGVRPQAFNVFDDSIRDILDNDAIALVCKETELQQTLDSLSTLPRLVVTDSQVYGMVARIVPEEVFLTSFSVVLARAKGLFEEYIKGTPALDKLKEGDRVLMLESCTHNVTCEDIGRVKLPKLIAKHAGCRLEFDAVAGLSALERPVTDYALVIQCGGCVVSPKQLASLFLFWNLLKFY